MTHELNPTTTPDVPSHLKDRIAASYDAIAHEYNDWTKPHYPLKTKWLTKLLDHLNIPSTPFSSTSSSPAEQPPARKFLELGCGAGEPILSTLLSLSPTNSIVANDLSPVQVQLARAALSPNFGTDRTEYIAGDMLQLSFPENTFDAVIALYSICHLPPQEQKDMFAKLISWVKPGGGVLVNVASQKSEGIVADEWIKKGEGWMYWSGLGPEGSVRVIEEGGRMNVVEQAMDGGDDETFYWIIARKEE